MSKKYLVGTAIAAALMFGAQAASACSISAWQGGTVGLTAADTGEPSTFKRYSGRCGLRVPNSNSGAGRFVADNTPNNETSYRARFYYFTGDISGPTTIFQARDTGSADIISITHDGNLLSFSSNATGGTAQTRQVQDSKYYSIEIEWAAGSPGSMRVTVTGAGSATPVGGVANFALTNAGASITEVRMGMIAGTPTIVAPVFFDEFDSRRTQNPGRLLRGDANNDGSVLVGDAIQARNEALGGALAVGQPDCNEDGDVFVGDAICIRNIALTN